MAFMKEFLQFLKVRKKYWLIPIFILMVLLGVVIVVAKGSAVAPLIYTVF